MKKDLSATEMVLVACEAPKHFMAADLSDPRRHTRVIKPLLKSANYFEVGHDVMEAGLTLVSEHTDIFADLLPRCRLPFPTMIMEWDALHSLRFAGQEPEKSTPPRVAALLQQDESMEKFYVTILGTDPFDSNGCGTWTAAVSIVSFVVSPDVEFAAHDGLIHDVAEEWFSTPNGKQSLGFLDKLVPASVAVERHPYNYKLMIPMILGRHPVHGQENVGEASATWDILKRIARHCKLDLCHPLKHLLLPGFSDETKITYMRTEWAAPGQTPAQRTYTSPRSDMMKYNVISAGINEDIGLLRKVLGVLCLMNAKDREVGWSDPWAPHGKFSAGGKIMPYLTRRRLTLLLPRAVVLSRLGKIARANAGPKRRHEVEGHWCSSRKRGKPDCELAGPGKGHKHEAVNPRLKECACGHIVWFKQTHERGDAGKGYVIKDYVLRKRPKVGGETSVKARIIL